MSFFKRLSLISLITMLLVLSGWISLLLIADYHAGKTERALNNWRTQQRTPNETDWQESYANITSALKYDSSNPIYIEKRAELFRWKSLGLNNTQQDKDSVNQKVLESYRQLIKLKPSWPNYWAVLVQTKRELWQYDNEMQQAIQNAAHYGPWLKNNQLIILSTGYRGWAFLDKRTQQAVSDTLERAIKIQPKQTIQLALNTGFTNQILPHLEKDKGLMQTYSREIANRIKNLSP